MNILEQLAHVGSELPVVEATETQPILPEITTQAQLDDILASHEHDEPLGLQFFPETCVHTLAVGEQVYVVNEFEAPAPITYPENDFTYVVPDAYDRACRQLLKRHGITCPVESLQTQVNILGGSLPNPVLTGSLVPAFKVNKELLQQHGNWEWYTKLRDAQFLAEGPEFSVDHEKFMQNLTALKPEAQKQWAQLLTVFPGEVPVHLTPNGQISGRFSTHAPNLQGLPKVLRPAFYVESYRRCHLVAADYRQIQPRILAALSGDSEWNRPFAEGIDFYRHCASAMFGKAIEDITDDERAVSKSISMGIVFGMGVDKMLETLEERDITSIDKAHAVALRQAFLDRFPTLMTWRDNLSRSKYAGNIEGDTAHRTLRLPSGRQIVYDAAGFGQQPLCSHLAQGIEAEIVLNAILKFRKASAEQAINARIALVIHDELLIACRGTESDAQAAGDLLKTCMEKAFWEYPSMPHAEGIVKVSSPSMYWGAGD